MVQFWIWLQRTRAICDVASRSLSLSQVINLCSQLVLSILVAERFETVCEVLNLPCDSCELLQFRLGAVADHSWRMQPAQVLCHLPNQLECDVERLLVAIWSSSRSALLSEEDHLR